MKLILACTPSGGIGYKNGLPWVKIQGDLPRFSKLTTGQTIIMGRNTWESLPKKPLPNRINVVVSSSPILNGVKNLPRGVIQRQDCNFDHKDAWLIGGAQMVISNWNLIDEIHLTTTNQEYRYDVGIDTDLIYDDFSCILAESHSDHTYQIFKRETKQ